MRSLPFYVFANFRSKLSTVFFLSLLFWFSTQSDYYIVMANVYILEQEQRISNEKESNRYSDSTMRFLWNMFFYFAFSCCFFFFFAFIEFLLTAKLFKFINEITVYKIVTHFSWLFDYTIWRDRIIVPVDWLDRVHHPSIELNIPNSFFLWPFDLV